jgi:long-chain acyl-CoA synthetase
LIVTALPLYHIFALTANCFLMGIRIGATNLLIANPRDIPGFVKELAKYPFTRLDRRQHAVQRAAQQRPDFRKLDFSPLISDLRRRHGRAEGGGRRWKQVTGKPLLEAYGLTETSPARPINPLNIARVQRLDRPADALDRIVDPRRRRQRRAASASRRICIRGPQVMGLLEPAGRDRQGDDRRRLLRTGDMGGHGRQRLHPIVDRKKDMILVSGFNVYPNEVEEVVAMHPGVLEVAAIGVPDEKSGEAVKLFVVKKDPALTPDN